MYKKINSGWLKHWDFELLDMVVMEAAFLMAYFIRHIEVFPDLYMPYMYGRLAVLLAVFDLVVVCFDNNYKSILQRNKTQEMVATFKHVTIVQLLLPIYQYMMPEEENLSRWVFMVSWCFGFLGCLLGRLVLKKYVRKRMTSARNQSRMMILVAQGHAGACIRQLYQKTWRNYRVTAIGVIDSMEKEDAISADIPVLFGKDHVMEYLRQGVVDEIYIDTFVDREDLNRQVDTFLGMGITVHIGMGFLPENLPNQIVERMGDAYVVTTAVKAASGWQLAMKRFMDIVGGLTGLLCTGVIYLFVAPLIKLSSPGPVFFKQKRIGKNGRVFEMYKFRSMYMDAEERLQELQEQNEMQGLMFKLENDPRIIGSEKGPGRGIGNFIRKTSLDEFPQFWNVLRGDMSLVGTRPPTLNEYEQYDFHHKIRLSMKPGITGLWQISGRSDITDFDKVVELDTAYIENWTLVLDMKILCKTVAVVLGRKGSR